MVDFTDLVQEIDFGPDETSDEYKEHFDFSSPEDVLIEVVGPHEADKPLDNWQNWSIESCTVIASKEGVTGAAQYDQSYGAGLDYTIQSMIEPPGEGWFVVAGVTGRYFKGDGWTSDDDMDFYFETVRPATEEEKKLA